MLLPQFAMKYIKVGSGSIIGKDNIEEFLNYINSLSDSVGSDRPKFVHGVVS